MILQNDSLTLFLYPLSHRYFLIKDKPPRMGSLVKLDNSLTLRIFQKYTNKRN